MEPNKPRILNVPKLSEEEMRKRAPLPPDILANALQDTVHEEIGISRVAKSYKIPKE